MGRGRYWRDGSYLGAHFPSQTSHPTLPCQEILRVSFNGSLQNINNNEKKNPKIKKLLPHLLPNLEDSTMYGPALRKEGRPTGAAGRGLSLPEVTAT